MSLAYDDAMCIDRDADDQAENDAKLEAALEEFADDLFEQYFDGNQKVVEEVDEAIVEAMEHVLLSLRESFDGGKTPLYDAYKRAVTLACRSAAHCIEDFKHLERFRRECDV